MARRVCDTDVGCGGVRGGFSFVPENGRHKKAARLLYGLRETAFITRESHAVRTASKAGKRNPPADRQMTPDKGIFIFTDAGSASSFVQTVAQAHYRCQQAYPTS